jgi:signal transduction histidine kinase
MFATRTIKFLQTEVDKLYQESLVRRILRAFGTKFDDGVGQLRYSPLGMFIYNLRFGVLAACLIGLSGAVFRGLLETNNIPVKFWETLVFLAAGVALNIGITIFLHPQFRKHISRSSPNEGLLDVHSIFNIYFTLDACILITILFFGTVTFRYPVQGVVFLLLANVVVFSAYLGSQAKRILVIIGLVTAISIATWFILPWMLTLYFQSEASWFSSLITWATATYAIAISMASVAMISHLRKIEIRISERSLMQLGKLSKLLGNRSQREKIKADQRLQQVWFRLMLQELCDFDSPFQYYFARMWIVERHINKGNLLIQVETQGRQRAGGQSVYDMDFLLKLCEGNEPLIEDTGNYIRSFVPLKSETTALGLLELNHPIWAYSSFEQEKAFLSSLDDIISATIKQTRLNEDLLARAAIDQVLASQSLKEAFQLSVSILRSSLDAEASMIIFRPDKTKPQMEVVAFEGIGSGIKKNFYEVDKGLTGRCAKIGKTIRRDDAQEYRDGFDSVFMSNLETALGKKVQSWLAAPIGPADNNHGVIKVVNKNHKYLTFFTDADEALTKQLGEKLRIVFEKLKSVQDADQARRESDNRAIEADRARKNAELRANEHRQNITILTHQVQGPLTTIKLELTDLIEQENISPYLVDDLDRILLATNDAMYLTSGIYAGVAVEAENESGKKYSHLVETDIDVASELSSVCKSLQRRYCRDDLRFTFRQDEHFPRIRLDKHFFTGVIYSLIHNAMKYADQRSEVVMECGFEWPLSNPIDKVPAIKVKSYGQPIYQNEKEMIFSKGIRGQSVKNTNPGTGLGLWVARTLMRHCKGDVALELVDDIPRLSIFVVTFPPSQSLTGRK